MSENNERSIHQSNLQVLTMEIYIISPFYIAKLNPLRQIFKSIVQADNMEKDDYTADEPKLFIML